MSITVLPVRDVEYQEPRTSTYATPRPTPVSRDRFEGMHSTAVELLRAPIKRPAYVGPPTETTAPARSTASPAPPPQAAPTSPTAAEIELPNGRIVRVPPGFASADLERVLAIAGSDDPTTP